MASSRLIIVRHAESHYNVLNRIQGQWDSELTVHGRRQARHLARRLKNFKIHKVYSSDLSRAYSTSVEITRYLKTEIIREPRLREIHLGAWEGMTPEEVDERHAGGYRRWLEKPSRCHIPGSEKLSDFRKRVTGCVADIARKNKGKTSLVITHGGAITAMLCEWLKADFDTALLHMHIENTSLTFVEYKDEHVKVHGANDTAHLPARQRNDRHFID